MKKRRDEEERKDLLSGFQNLNIVHLMTFDQPVNLTDSEMRDIRGEGIVDEN